MGFDQYCMISYNSGMSTKIPTKTLLNSVAKNPQFLQKSWKKFCKKELTGNSTTATIVTY
jgi:hypothetical protein